MARLKDWRKIDHQPPPGGYSLAEPTSEMHIRQEFACERCGVQVAAFLFEPGGEWDYRRIELHDRFHQALSGEQDG